MEPHCGYSGVVRALVYCKSDLAKLCLNCDTRVHSANPLSRRHRRSLLCDKCILQPTVIHCIEDKVSFCQDCHWTGVKCFCLEHRLQSLNPYSGCPSMAEFARMGSSISEPFSLFRGFGSGWVTPYVTSLPLNENSLSSCLDQRDHNNGTFGLIKMNDIEGLMDSSSSQNQIYPQTLRDQSPFFSIEPNFTKEYPDLCMKLKDGDDICEGLDMDDVPFNFEAGEDILGCLQSHTNYNQFENTGPGYLLVDKNSSVTESNYPVVNALEASSPGQQDCIGYQSSQTAGGSTNNLIQPVNGNGDCSRNISIGLPLPLPIPSPAGQVRPSMSLSLSNITGESSANDYQDCGLSPAFLMGDSPWESNFEGSNPQARDQAKLRYNQKKSKRMFGKQIRYASRKARADTRKRMKGRFVKAGEAYDYDPLVSRNF